MYPNPIKKPNSTIKPERLLGPMTVSGQAVPVGDITKTEQMRLGQYMTERRVAEFVSELLPISESKDIRLLDPGAGRGALSFAFLQRWLKERSPASRLQIDAWEIDGRLAKTLADHVRTSEIPANAQFNVHNSDFIQESLIRQGLLSDQLYTHAILNPPYSKLHSQSSHARALRENGLASTNTYSAFLALSLRMLEDGGSLAAIVPRSFCNGRYYQPLRRQILSEASIKRIHVFESRTDAFKRDGVIQENIVIVITKGRPQADVCVSFSKDSTLKGTVKYRRSISELVSPRDTTQVIALNKEEITPRLLTSPDSPLQFLLAELNINVSTGPIVDFRAKGLTTASPENSGAIPLIHSHHLHRDALAWPSNTRGKMNSIQCEPGTLHSLLPAGNYVAMRRFSSKEQSRRIVCNVVEANSGPFKNGLTFENHVNFLHVEGAGMDRELAWGFAAYLNSGLIDGIFRSMSGSTQVNVSDLKIIRFPSLEKIKEIGIIALTHGTTSPTHADRAVNEVLGLSV